MGAGMQTAWPTATTIPSTPTPTFTPTAIPTIAPTIDLIGRPKELREWTDELGFSTTQFCGAVLQRETHGAWQDDSWFDGRDNDPGRIFTEAATRWYWSWIQDASVKAWLKHDPNNSADQELMIYNWTVYNMQSEDNITKPLLEQYLNDLKPEFTQVCEEILAPKIPEWKEGTSMWGWANANLYNAKGRLYIEQNHKYKYGSGCTAWYIVDGATSKTLYELKAPEWPASDCK